MVHAAMAQHGLTVFAHEQTKGRGQRNRQWVADARSNITVSFVLAPPELSTSQMFLLSRMVATAVYRFFNKYTTGELAIKWPNDLYWRDRKAGGILIENVIQGSEWKYAIAGIGLNINQTSFDDLEGRAVSLKQITGRTFEPLALVKELAQYMEEQFQLLVKDPQALTRFYNDHLYKLQEVVRFKKENRLFEARVEGVSDLGQLIVRHAVEERFDVGEVEWLIS